MIDVKPKRRHSDVETMSREQLGILSFVCGMLFIIAINVFISGVAG